ncbi:MAG: cytochrome c oxidase subunit 3 [Bacteroidota bacterium]
MNATIFDVKPNQTKNKIHPQKFALWVACASIVMMFVGFTSAFVVRRAAGNWLEFNLPSLFYWNAGLIVASSLVLHFSKVSLRKSNFSQYRTLLVTGVLMGFGFVILQYEAWMQMMSDGIYLDGNPAGSFVYVISGVHAAHVLGGIIALFAALFHAYTLKDFVTKGRLHRLDLTVTYWHFVGILWLYLVFFFVLNS